ncbi:MAG: hypothetical protein KGZ83_13770 [Sulfuricella sp.]|nr:hypothetical protein [Sulfuricella sp.]
MSFTRNILAASITLAAVAPFSASAVDNNELAQIRDQIKQMKEGYEARIEALEKRLEIAEASAAKSSAPAQKTAQSAAPQPSAPVGAAAFNPEVSLILTGTYANLSQDPANYRIAGFLPSGGEIGPGARGFNLGESELAVAANIDPYLRGQLTLAMTPENTVAVEEAFVQSLGLGHGFTLKGGRYLSGVGYLNEQHSHTWDFVDAPLAYQAFFGGQLKDEGVQVKWLAPSDTFIELGAEIGRGRNFPASNRAKNGTGASTLFAHSGGDVGTSHAWRAGLSYLRTSPQGRTFETTDNFGNTVGNTFSGESQLAIADFVWKWAPNGNPVHTNFKLQGEYFRRKEDGHLTYDSAALANTDRYSALQSGWYLQGIYQFMPRWRVGLRRDQLNGGTLDYAGNAAALAREAFNPSKNTLMVDYSPSEFSRFRVQLAQDMSRPEATDRQLFLQYQMSLGAHGAHKF